MKDFEPQNISNLAWSYASLGIPHSALFQSLGDVVLSADLKTFNSQDIANTVWAYAKLDIKHAGLFEKVGDHVVELDNLKSFKPQALANIMWAYSAANVLREDLFEKIGNAEAHQAKLQPFDEQSQRRSKLFFPVNDYDNIDDLLRHSIAVLKSGGFLNTAPVWARISRLIIEWQQKGDTSSIEQNIDALLNHTIATLNETNLKHITTIVLSMAKIAKNVSQASGRQRLNDYQQAFGSIVLDRNQDPNTDLFLELAESTDHLIAQFEPRNLSNLAYAYALIGRNPQLDRGCTLRESIGNISITCMKCFNPQEISNLAWSYASLGIPHSTLFQSLGDVVSHADLNTFRPQALANTVWAYAKLDMKHAGLFEKVGNHVVASGDLKSFSPRELANIVWAYAKLAEHPGLFEKVGDHVVSWGNLKSYKPQDFSNFAWAYANAGVRHPDLLRRIGDHIVALGDLKQLSTSPCQHRLGICYY
jgi:hypothetical protein